jgi:hypothetical protein
LALTGKGVMQEDNSTRFFGSVFTRHPRQSSARSGSLIATIRSYASAAIRWSTWLARNAALLRGADRGMQ